MPDSTPPVLVYNRIEANKRKTRLLLASFALVLLPVVSASAVVALPGVTLVGGAIAFAIYGWELEAKLQSLDAAMNASRPAQGMPGLLDLPGPVLMIMGGALTLALVIVVLALIAATAFLISRYGARVVLRLARARPVGAAQEPELFRVVENLCIGAGLPTPSLHVVESAAPNAFATGLDPQRASLVVTRGLLTLMDRRELDGVIAHELSHIGNHDIRLSTTLTALVGTMSLPLRMVAAPFRFAFRLHRTFGILVLAIGFLYVVPLVLALFAGFSALVSGEISQEIPAFLLWWVVHAMLAPVYAVLVAPIIALLIRQAVSRQREFLADADAVLLTRDPEGLALALVKIGAVGGERLRVGEGTVHLYFVDPLSKGSWLHVVFPSHPSLEKRVELLAGMGNGIAPSAIQAARDAGARVQHTKSGLDEVHAPLPGPPCDETAFSTQATEPTGTSDGGFTRLYDRPDDGSRVVALLPEDAVVKVERREGDFVRVATESGVAGWVFRSAPLDIQGVAAADHALTPLYEQPDGWSRVLARLPESAVVIPVATEGHFIRVTTAEHQTGYVSRLAPLTALKSFQK